MNPTTLTVYASPYPKERIGKKFDGGYMIVNIPNKKYTMLLAGGVGNDLSFESDFCRKFNVQCFAYDGTITNAPPADARVKWVNENIVAGSFRNDISTGKAGDFFLKMDIEGYEIPWLESMTSDELAKFGQIVMEFHSPFSERHGAVFEKLNRTHALVHFHANNCCGTRIHGGVQIPNIFECTYVLRNLLPESLALNTDTIPSPLDQRNLGHIPEISINWPPFVHQ